MKKVINFYDSDAIIVNVTNYRSFMGRFIDLTGITFGRWVVLRRGPNKKEITTWTCQCTCQKQTISNVVATTLTRGKSQSCGCLRAEQMKEKSTKHGLAFHPAYKTWSSMKRRCYGKTHHKYKNYGLLGVIIEEPWFSDPKSFIDWCIKNDWEPGNLKQVDRIDPNGNYSPENCRIVDNKTNCNNRRSHIYAEVYGETLTLSQAIDKYAVVSGSSVRRRYQEYKWNILDSLLIPAHKNPPSQLISTSLP